jgi:hypothetical protein
MYSRTGFYPGPPCAWHFTDPRPRITKRKQCHMSRRNGDRARFQKERKKKMLRRQRVQEFIKAVRPVTTKPADAPDAAKA